MSRKRWGRYPAEFRQIAVERMKLCANVKELAEELGVSRTVLYYWKAQPQRDSSEACGSGESDLRVYQVRELNVKVAQLEAVIGRQTLELDFFAGALRRVEEKRQSKGSTGGKRSTSRSES